MMKKRKATIFSGLVNVDTHLAGTAVIYQKIADLLLRSGYDVDMVIPKASDLKSAVNFHLWSEKNNRKLIDRSRLVVFGAYPPVEPMLYASEKKKIIMTYLWSIAPIGSLEFKDFTEAKRQNDLYRYIRASYNLSLLLSDKIFCRDNKIRDLIIGSLISLGRIGLDGYRKSRNFKSLVEAAPFGIEKGAPKHKKNIYRGVIKGVGKSDFLLIWNGGIWNWNDGASLIETMRAIRDVHKKRNIKLIIQGFRHPDKDQKISKEADKTLFLAKKYRMVNDSVFFLDSWIPYKDRGNYLTECDAGIVTSPDIPEANFFLKTRIYDYIWAGLPVLLGDNEAFASFVSKMNLGVVSSCGRANEWAKNIVEFSSNKIRQAKIKNDIKKAKNQMLWSKTLSPVKKFVSDPQKDGFAASNNILQINIKQYLDILKQGF